MKKINNKLIKVMVIYGLAFLLIAAIGLGIFAAFLSGYEKSRLTTVAADYLSNTSDTALDTMVRSTVEALNFDIQSEEECYAQLRGVIRNAKPAFIPSESSEGKTMYALKSDGSTIGRLLLVPVGEAAFGFSKYEVTPLDFDLSAAAKSSEVVVPDGWTVSVNGTKLGEEYITGSEEYSLLNEFYGDKFVEMPELRVYNTGLYISEPVIELKDEKGNTVESFDEASYCDNCSSAKQKEISAVAEAFVTAYINYSSNSSNSIYGNYYALEEYMVKGSPLQIRMRSAEAGLGWSTSYGDKLLSIDYHSFMDLGDGMYLCDLTYKNETHSMGGVFVTDNNLKLILTEAEGGKLLVAAMSSY